MKKILIYSINRTDDFWKETADNLEYSTKIVSDIRGKGDFNLVEKYNRLLKKNSKSVILSS